MCARALSALPTIAAPTPPMQFGSTAAEQVASPRQPPNVFEYKLSGTFHRWPGLWRLGNRVRLTHAPSGRGLPFSAWCWPQAPCVSKTCCADGVDVVLGFRRCGYHSELKATTPRWHFEPITRDDAQDRVPQNGDVARPFSTRNGKREEAGRRAQARSNKNRGPRLGPAPRRRLWTRAVQVPAPVREVPQLIQKILGEPLVARAAHDEELDAFWR